MNPGVDQPIGVALFSMGDRPRVMLQLFLERHLDQKFRVTDPEDARLAIIDLDGTQGSQDWEAFRASYPNLPTVALSVRKQDISGARLVTKPVSGAALLAALNQLCQELPEPAPDTTEPVSEGAPPKRGSRTRHRSVSAHTQSVSAALGDRAENSRYGAFIDAGKDGERFFQANRYYLSVVTQVLDQVAADGQPRVIEGDLQRAQPILCIADHAGMVRCPLSDGVLRYLCIVPLSEQNVVVKPWNPAETYKITGNQVTRESFIWKMALWSARGRCPEGTALDATVVLDRWPNLPCLLPTPYAMRIAALWMSRPTSLANTARQLNIPLSHVLAFYAAANATGIARIAPVDESSEVTVPLTPVPPPDAGKSPRGSFFSRVIIHLFRRS